MNRQLKFMVLGGLFTSIPTACLSSIAGGLNLSNSDASRQVALAMLPAVLLTGVLIGLGTSLIHPHKWSLFLGAQLGWLTGVLATGFIASALQLSQVERASLLLWGLGVPLIGILPGLVPALVGSLLGRSKR